MKVCDHRATPLRALCNVTAKSIDELASLSKAGALDGLTAMEYGEYFYGALLVACQAYASGTVCDINEISGSKNEKLELYKHKVDGSKNYTCVELINSLANYFKHNEEWASWPENQTTKALRYYGINESTEFPLNYGVRIILGSSSDLRLIAESLEDWRFSLLTTIVT